jgi:hypothetical protein
MALDLRSVSDGNVVFMAEKNIPYTMSMQIENRLKNVSCKLFILSHLASLAQW